MLEIKKGQKVYKHFICLLKNMILVKWSFRQGFAIECNRKQIKVNFYFLFFIYKQRNRNIEKILSEYQEYQAKTFFSNSNYLFSRQIEFYCSQNKNVAQKNAQMCFGQQKVTKKFFWVS